MTIINALGNSLTGRSGTGTFVGSSAPTLNSPDIGAATASSVSFSGGTALTQYITAGNWSPTLSFVTPGNLSVSYVNQTGLYSRSGNYGLYYMLLVCTPTYTTASGNLRIGGSPFALSGVSVAGDIIKISALPWPALRTEMVPVSVGSTTTFQILGHGSSTGNSILSVSNILSGVAFTLEFTHLVRL